MPKKDKQDVNEEFGATLAYKASEDASGTSTGTPPPKMDSEPTSPEREASLPEGVELFFWSGRNWYKVGERLFDGLDKALDALKNR